MHALAPAQIGRYEVLEELGRGPASVVYRARDPEIERIVAIKVFDLDGQREEWDQYRERLLQRVREASTLSHPGILKIFDLGEDEPACTPYIVSEYAEGQSLEQILAAGDKFSQGEALRLAAELLDSLEYAHSQRAAHLNLKPSNLIIGEDGHSKISDFGGIRLGGLSTFVAPEQLRGLGDNRSDLFSFGVILYLMLSGHRPFQGSSDATISFKVIHQHPVPVAALNFELSPEVDFVIGRLLAKNPDERYQGAQEAKQDIQRIQQDRSSGGGPDRPDVALIYSHTSSHRPNSGLRALIAGRSLKLILILMLLALTYFGYDGLLSLKVPPPPVAFSPRLLVPPAALSRTTVPAQPLRTRQRKAPRDNRARAAARFVNVPIEVVHPFSEFVLSIWIDDHLAYSNSVRRERKKRFLHIGASVTSYLTLLQVPIGEHLLRLQVKSAEAAFDQTTTLMSVFSRPFGQKLRVRYGEHGKLSAEIN